MRNGLQRNTLRWFAVLACVSLLGTARADTALERLLDQYGRIQALTCQVRRESRTGDQELRMLSQIWYQRPDRLFVESVAAGVDGITRRILADGKTLYMHIEGQAEGLARPIAALDAAMRVELRRVPGTPMDHLLRLRDAEAIPLDGTEAYPERIHFAQPGAHVVLKLDPLGRPAEIRFYRSADLTDPFAHYVYTGFREVLDGVWIPMRHTAEYAREDGVVQESVRISGVEIHSEVPAARFDVKTVFPDVRFVTE